MTYQTYFFLNHLQFGMMETIVVGVTDRFPDSVGKKKHRVKFVFFCCVVGFLFGIPLTTKVHFQVIYHHMHTLYISPNAIIN